MYFFVSIHQWLKQASRMGMTIYNGYSFGCPSTGKELEIGKPEHSNDTSIVCESDLLAHLNVVKMTI